MDPSPPADVDMPAVDLMLGVVACALGGMGALLYVTRPVAALVLRPPLAPAPLQPQTWLSAIARQGRTLRERVTPQAEVYLQQVVEGVVARIDFEAVVARIDVATIARQVVDDIDLPDLIRDSSGALASESVLGLRRQGIEADERVSKIVDKVLLRRNARKTLVQSRAETQMQPPAETPVQPRADEPVP
jgi:hypothetical protein